MRPPRTAGQSTPQDRRPAPDAARRRLLRGLGMGAIGLATAPVLSASTAAGSAPLRGLREVRVLGAPEGGYYARYASALAYLLRTEHGADATAQLTKGTIENLSLLAAEPPEGTVVFSLSAADLTDEEYTAGASHLRAVARLFDEYLHIVVADNGPVRTVADLAGRNLSTGPPGSSTEVIAPRAVRAMGVNTDRVRFLSHDITDAPSRFLSGAVDAYAWSSGLPTRGVTRAAQMTEIRLLNVSGAVTRIRPRHPSLYRAATVPAGTYPGQPETSTIACPALLITRADTPGAAVRSVLDTLFERGGRLVEMSVALDRRAAVSTGKLPLHPAAAEYFRSVKP